VDPALARQQVLLRFDPYDLSQIQVWHEGKQYADAVPFRLRNHRYRGIEPETTPLATEGLNYLELARQQHAASKQSELGGMSFARLVKADGRDRNAH